MIDEQKLYELLKDFDPAVLGPVYPQPGVRLWGPGDHGPRHQEAAAWGRGLFPGLLRGGHGLYLVAERPPVSGGMLSPGPGAGGPGPRKARLAAVEPAGLHVPAAGWVYLPIYPGLSRVLTRLDESPFPVIR